MKGKYRSDKLVVGNFQYISTQEDPHVPMVETTEQKYIFEIIQKGNGDIKYREVFTGDEFDGKPSHKRCDGIELVVMNFPYVVNIEPLSEKMDNVSDMISKSALLLVLNEVNEKRSSKKFNK